MSLRPNIGGYKLKADSLKGIPEAMMGVAAVLQKIKSNDLWSDDREIILKIQYLIKRARNNKNIGGRAHKAAKNAFDLIRPYTKMHDLHHPGEQAFKVFMTIAQELAVALKLGLRHGAEQYAKELEKLRRQQKYPELYIRDTVILELIDMAQLAKAAEQIKIGGSAELLKASEILSRVHDMYYKWADQGKSDQERLQLLLQAYQQAEQMLGQAVKKI